MKLNTKKNVALAIVATLGIGVWLYVDENIDNNSISIPFEEHELQTDFKKEKLDANKNGMLVVEDCQEKDCKIKKSKRESDDLKLHIKNARKNETDKAKRKLEKENPYVNEDINIINYSYFSNGSLSLAQMQELDIKNSDFSDFMENEFELTNREYADSSFKPVNFLVIDSNDKSGKMNIKHFFDNINDDEFELIMPSLHPGKEEVGISKLNGCKGHPLGGVICKNGSFYKRNEGYYHFKKLGWPPYMLHVKIKESGQVLIYDEMTKEGEFPERKAFSGW